MIIVVVLVAVIIMICIYRYVCIYMYIYIYEVSRHALPTQNSVAPKWASENGFVTRKS